MLYFGWLHSLWLDCSALERLCTEIHDMITKKYGGSLDELVASDNLLLTDFPTHRFSDKGESSNVCAVYFNERGRI